MKASTLEKIVALAIHPATTEAEWQAAAIAFFRMHRRKGTSPLRAQEPQIQAWNRPARPFSERWPSGPVWMPTADDGNLKYPGLNIREILKQDSEYAVELIAERNGRISAQQHKAKAEDKANRAAQAAAKKAKRAEKK